MLSMSGLEPAAQLAWTRSLSLRLSYGNPCDRSVFAAERYSESAAVMVSADEALELRFQHRGVYRSCSELLPSPETSRHACGARIARMDVAPAAVRFACRRFMRSCTVWNQSCRHAAPLQAAHAQAVGSTSAGARLPVRKALLFGSVRLDGMQQTNLQHAKDKPATSNRQTYSGQEALQHATSADDTRGAAIQMRYLLDLYRSLASSSIDGSSAVGRAQLRTGCGHATSNEQHATSNMQRATSNEQRTTSCWPGFRLRVVS